MSGMPKKQTINFPKHFLWGVATSAHQIEGGTHNQWSVWELENAKSLAAKAAYQYGDLPGWKERYSKKAADPSSYISAQATDHYHLYERDFDIVKHMNMNAFRFSVEWSRIEPNEGVWDAAEIAHYKKYVVALKKRNIEPVLTLFHFTLPVWFIEKGGFEKRRNIAFFVRFTEKVISELGVGVKYIITLNEPEGYVRSGYIEATTPPQVINKRLARRVTNNLAYAHNKAAQAIHSRSRRYKVSIAQDVHYVYPGDDSWLSERSAAWLQYQKDDKFLGKVIKTCDFIGVNYYVSERVYGYRVHNPDERLNDMGWDMQPADIQFVLERLSRKYKKPMIITENGLADGEDTHRKWWITETIMAMQRALENGVQLDGYLHWSLLDNFEWDKGHWPQFGLCSVNRATLKRTPRPSAIWFSKIIKKLRRI